MNISYKHDSEVMMGVDSFTQHYPTKISDKIVTLPNWPPWVLIDFKHK